MHSAVGAMQGPCSDIPLMNSSSSLLMKDGGQACWAPVAPLRLPPPPGMTTLPSTRHPAQSSVQREQLGAPSLHPLWPNPTYSSRPRSSTPSLAVPFLSTPGLLYQPSPHPWGTPTSVLESNTMWLFIFFTACLLSFITEPDTQICLLNAAE